MATNRDAKPKSDKTTEESPKEDVVTTHVKALEKRAKKEKVPFPKALKERLLSLKTKGSVKREWKQYLIALIKSSD